MAKKLTFMSTINREGESGPIRGKIPAPMCAELGVKPGGALLFTVSNGRVVSVEVLSPKEARAERKERGTESRFGSRDTGSKSKGKASKDKGTTKKSSKKDKKAGNSKSKKSRADDDDDDDEQWDTAPRKKAKKSSKSSKRKTRVDYDDDDEPRVKRGTHKKKSKYSIGKK